MDRNVTNLAPAVCGAGFVLCVLLWGAGYLGQWWLPLDVFSHFRWHILWMALVLCVAGLTGRIWLQVAVIGLFLIYTGFGLSPLVAQHLFTPPAAAGARGEGSSIKVLSFNSWYENRDHDAIEAMLRTADADIVLLQEVFRDKLPLLERVRDLYPHQAICRDTFGCSQVTLSKQPFASYETVTLRPELPVLMVRFAGPWEGLQIANIHTLRPPFMALQRAQMEALASFARRQQGPLIVGGDFNATPHSMMFETFENGSGLKPLQFWPTWPVSPLKLPQLSIDHFFLTDDFEVVEEARPLAYAGSDHLPITVTLRRAGAGG